jgi:hypothetical protein
VAAAGDAVGEKALTDGLNLNSLACGLNLVGVAADAGAGTGTGAGAAAVGAVVGAGALGGTCTLSLEADADGGPEEGGVALLASVRYLSCSLALIFSWSCRKRVSSSSRFSCRTWRT